MPGFGTSRRTTIGKMRQRVSIQRQLQTGTDDRGHPMYQWSSVVADVPCSIETLRGNEAERAKQLFASATHRVEMRTPAASITEEMKLVFKGRDLFIGFIDDLSQVGRFVQLLVAERK